MREEHFVREDRKGRAPSASTERASLEQLLARNVSKGLLTRNNAFDKYVPLLGPYFEAIRDRKYRTVPAPFCVQIQISSRCSTRCPMCLHYADRGDELSLEECARVFRELSNFGVRAIVLSGGEPVARPDLNEVLRLAWEHGLRIGVFTNGCVPSHDQEVRLRVAESLGKYADWIAVSVDGGILEDARIRVLIEDNELDRRRFLREFCSAASRGRAALSATVTVQKENVHADICGIGDYIRGELGIEMVLWKFACGSVNALGARQPYLIDLDELRAFLRGVKESVAVEEDWNNLVYLMGCFEEGPFDQAGVANGEPVREFYTANSVRCFTPFLFSLIDSDGTVYPCCHLYRDNHSRHWTTGAYRAAHALGNVRVTSFAEIWNGERYAAKRRELEVIRPGEPQFRPCGECTRHCQHNKVLSEVYGAYEGDMTRFHRDVAEARAKLEGDNLPVWF